MLINKRSTTLLCIRLCIGFIALLSSGELHAHGSGHCHADDKYSDHYPTFNIEIISCADSIFSVSEGVPSLEAGNDWGVAWGDYDNDGNVDLFIVDNSPENPNRLYKNNGDGSFTYVTDSGALTTDAASSIAAAWGDYDNDNDLDLFVTNNLGFNNFLYRNNGDATFTKIYNDPVVNHNGYSHGATWVDYDNDGFLDLFITESFATRFNKLYHNNGDGTFSENNTALITLEASSSISATWADYNDDGWLDLFVANTYNENNNLYKNLGNGNFEKITTGSIVSDGGASVGASWGDYDNDGDFDLFVANAGDQHNFLYRNDGADQFTKITFGDIVNNNGHSHGSAWGDFDNDGDLDLYVNNDDGQANFLYRNNGDGTFIDESANKVDHLRNAFGLAWADFDNDGDLDLFCANRAQDKSELFINEVGTCNNRVAFKLAGTISNQLAIGAKVAVKAIINGTASWQTRQVSSQTGGGTSGQSDQRIIIGLGDANLIDSVVIEWPSGYEQIYVNQPINTTFHIQEDIGAKICGVAYYDANNNCIRDSDEQGIPNIDLLINPGGHTVTTNDTGAYTITLPADFYAVSPQPNALWEQDCIVHYAVDALDLGATYCGHDFAYSPVMVEADLSVSIINTAHRIGEENLLAITFKNEGTRTTENTVLSFFHDEHVSLVNCSLDWSAYNGGVAYWILGELDMEESATIYLAYYIDPSTPVGTIINMNASIASEQTESVSTNNSYNSALEAVGSFDPNDIRVSPVGKIRPDQELVYKIRFQNVGNAAAGTIRIVDTLPSTLDFSTLEMGIASHAYRMEIENENTLVWTFENINLPDSTHNEPASHGYLYFKIKPKPGLSEGNRIPNYADIYFDSNASIQTNTVVNIIETEQAEETPFQAARLEIAPNPVQEYTRIQLPASTDVDRKIQRLAIFNSVGQRVFSLFNLSTRDFLFNRNQLPAGNYTVQILDDHLQVYADKMVVMLD